MKPHDETTSETRPASALRLAAQFLLPLNSFGAPERPTDAAGWSKAALWFPLYGLAVGILYAAVYRASWKWFGEYERLRLLPVALVLMADLGFCGYRQLAATVRLLAGRAPRPIDLGPPASVAVALAVLLKFMMLLSLPVGAYPWPADWREHLGPLFPAVIYRPLVLMPLWGRWALLLAMSLGRMTPQSPAPLRDMAGGVRLAAMMAWWLATTLLTIAYSSAAITHLAHGVVIALGVLVSTYLASFWMARRSGGQNEDTVLATGLVAEIAFLAFYLPVARLIYWY